MTKFTKSLLIGTSLLIASGSAIAQDTQIIGDIRVQANDEFIFVDEFPEGQEVTVTIAGDGDTDVDLYVVDTEGNTICEAEGLDDNETCTWTATSEGTYVISLSNLGEVYNLVNVTMTTSGIDVPGLDSVGEIRVDAEGSYVFLREFQGGQEAIVTIDGDDDTDVDLFVTDSAGNIICEGESFSDEETCTWTPIDTETYTIELKNLGDIYNVVQIYAN